MPTFSDFQFKTIGQPPDLLKRMTVADADNYVYDESLDQESLSSEPDLAEELLLPPELSNQTPDNFKQRSLRERLAVMDDDISKSFSTCDAAETHSTNTFNLNLGPASNSATRSSNVQAMVDDNSIIFPASTSPVSMKSQEHANPAAPQASSPKKPEAALHIGSNFGSAILNIADSVRPQSQPALDPPLIVSYPSTTTSNTDPFTVLRNLKSRCDTSLANLTPISTSDALALVQSVKERCAEVTTSLTNAHTLAQKAHSAAEESMRSVKECIVLTRTLQSRTDDMLVAVATMNNEERAKSQAEALQTLTKGLRELDQWSKRMEVQRRREVEELDAERRKIATDHRNDAGALSNHPTISVIPAIPLHPLSAPANYNTSESMLTSASQEVDAATEILNQQREQEEERRRVFAEELRKHRENEERLAHEQAKLSADLEAARAERIKAEKEEDARQAKQNDEAERRRKEFDLAKELKSRARRGEKTNKGSSDREAQLPSQQETQKQELKQQVISDGQHCIATDAMERNLSGPGKVNRSRQAVTPPSQGLKLPLTPVSPLSSETIILVQHPTHNNTILDPTYVEEGKVAVKQKAELAEADHPGSLLNRIAASATSSSRPAPSPFTKSPPLLGETSSDPPLFGQTGAWPHPASTQLTQMKIQPSVLSLTMADSLPAESSKPDSRVASTSSGFSAYSTHVDEGAITNSHLRDTLNTLGGRNSTSVNALSSLRAVSTQLRVNGPSLHVSGNGLDCGNVPLVSCSQVPPLSPAVQKANLRHLVHSHDSQAEIKVEPEENKPLFKTERNPTPFLSSKSRVLSQTGINIDHQIHGGSSNNLRNKKSSSTIPLLSLPSPDPTRGAYSVEPPSPTQPLSRGGSQDIWAPSATANQLTMKQSFQGVQPSSTVPVLPAKPSASAITLGHRPIPATDHKAPTQPGDLDNGPSAPHTQAFGIPRAASGMLNTSEVRRVDVPSRMGQQNLNGGRSQSNAIREKTYVPPPDSRQVRARSPVRRHIETRVQPRNTRGGDHWSPPRRQLSPLPSYAGYSRQSSRRSRSPPGGRGSTTSSRVVTPEHQAVHELQASHHSLPMKRKRQQLVDQTNEPPNRRPRYEGPPSREDNSLYVGKQVDWSTVANVNNSSSNPSISPQWSARSPSPEPRRATPLHIRLGDDVDRLPQHQGSNHRYNHAPSNKHRMSEPQHLSRPNTHTVDHIHYQAINVPRQISRNTTDSRPPLLDRFSDLPQVLPDNHNHHNHHTHSGRGIRPRGKGGAHQSSGHRATKGNLLDRLDAPNHE